MPAYRQTVMELMLFVLLAERLQAHGQPWYSGALVYLVLCLLARALETIPSDWRKWS